MKVGYVNKKIRKSIFCQQIYDIIFMNEDDCIEVICTAFLYEKALSLIEKKILFLHNSGEEVNLERIIFLYNEKIISPRWLFFLRYINKKICVKFYIKNYNKMKFSEMIFIEETQKDTFNLGDICRYGWYEYYYWRDHIPVNIENRFKKIKYYKILFEKSNSFSKNKNFFVNDYICVDSNDEYNYISIHGNSSYLLESAEIWSFFVGDNLLVNSLLILENGNLKFDITGEDKLEIIKIICENTNSINNEFAIYIFYHSVNIYNSKNSWKAKIVY